MVPTENHEKARHRYYDEPGFRVLLKGKRFGSAALQFLATRLNDER
jgi:hypothetical protein